MNFTAALGVLQGLLPSEEGSSGIKGRSGRIFDADLDIICAEGLPACGTSFWAACTDVNIDVRALSRLGPSRNAGIQEGTCDIFRDYRW